MARKGWLAGYYTDCECSPDYGCDHGGTFYFVVFGATRGVARYQALCRLVNEHDFYDLEYTDRDLGISRAEWADSIPEVRDRATRAEMFEHGIPLRCRVCSYRLRPGSEDRWEVGVVVGEDVYHRSCVPKEGVV